MSSKQGSLKPKVKKPKKIAHEKFYRQVFFNRKPIIYGSVLAVDPASTQDNCAWIMYSEGKVVETDIVPVEDSPDVWKRLRQIYDYFASLPTPDVLLIEQIGGVGHITLNRAVGIIGSACRAETVIEVPIPLWKREVDNWPKYQKNDTWDAHMVGELAMRTAKESNKFKAATKYIASLRSQAQGISFPSRRENCDQSSETLYSG